MKITVSKDATCGKAIIPAGEYWVALAAESQQILLVARGTDIKLPAIRRRSEGKSKTTTVQFYAGGGPIWSLVVSTPKQGEWVAMIELQSDKKDK